MNSLTKLTRSSIFAWLNEATWFKKIVMAKPHQPSDEYLNFLDVVIAEIPEAALVIDASGNLLRHNPKMEAVFKPEQLATGTALASLLDGLNVFSANKIAELSAKSFSEERFATLDIQGAEREYRMRILPMPVSDSSQWRMMMMDITDLVNLQKRRDRTLAILTHDMRTPIASLLAVCRDENLSQLDLKHNVKKHANLLLALIDDFILSIRADNDDYQTEEILLENLLDEAIYQVRELLQSRDMRLSCDFGEPLFVGVDARLMTRVMVNLIANAVRYGQQASTIQLLAKRSKNASAESAVTIIIENVVGTGQSIKLNEDKGFGMGLSFIRAVVGKHHGQFYQHISADAGTIARVEVVLPVIS
jgi:signal transduction histidine kinase